MTLFQSFVLGVVQGITEFLPISSSAHLVLIPWLFGWQDPGLAFDAFLHLGTLIAVLLYFGRDLFSILSAGIASIIERRVGYERERILFWLILFGNIPAGVAGLLFHDSVESTFRAPLLIAVSLAFVGFLLYWVDGRFPALRNSDDISRKDAFWIGIAQATALIPGVSRSGATITMGRLLGLNREAAARFSFLLSFPIILAAAVFKWHDLATQAGVDFSGTHLMVGLGSSTIFGILSIHLLLQFVRATDYAIFAWYRIALAGFIVLWSMIFKV